MTTMTFDQFRATGRDCADVRTVADDLMDFYDEPQPGRVYCERLYIFAPQAEPRGALMPGQWFLQIGRDEYVSESLPELERHLYEFALGGGYCDMTVADRLAAQFVALLRDNWLSPAEFAAMKHLNETDPLYAHDACASHNYCDANMAMAQAWEDVLGTEFDADDEAQTRLWSEAWEIARRNALGDPRRGKMRTLINDMVSAADGIVSLCEGASGDLATRGYPPSLKASFDEFLHELIEWRDAQLKGGPNR